jgi:hypothetical protein
MSLNVYRSGFQVDVPAFVRGKAVVLDLAFVLEKRTPLTAAALGVAVYTGVFVSGFDGTLFFVAGRRSYTLGFILLYSDILAYCR